MKTKFSLGLTTVFIGLFVILLALIWIIKNFLVELLLVSLGLFILFLIATCISTLIYQARNRKRIKEAILREKVRQEVAKEMEITENRNDNGENIEQGSGSEEVS